MYLILEQYELGNGYPRDKLICTKHDQKIDQNVTLT